jgi:dTDP-4-amino-4,6-dideoxy-D-galactose acyltransferase
MESESIKLLDWDTDFFGFPVAQITSNRLSCNELDYVDEFCRENKVRLLNFKCDAHHRPSVLAAEEYDFHLADVRMSYRQKLDVQSLIKPDLPVGMFFRRGTKDDVAFLRYIITDLYTHSRYYFDTNFPRDRVQEFYRNWIEKAVYGEFDDLVWVISNSHQPQALCSIAYGDERQARIGLFGVNPSVTGQGLGGCLIRSVLATLAECDFEEISVVTQGRNYAAQRLYQRAGFLIDQIEIYYHRWFDNINGECL